MLFRSNLSRKKLSITLGIKAARHEIVLLTTANCVPASNQWIKNIAKNFTDKTDIVIGATKFCTDKGLISNFIDFDTLQRNFCVFSYSLLLRPFYAEGTNLAYRKSLFFKNKGFARFMHLHLGDDDLFINQYATKRNAKIELAKDSLIIANYDNKRSAWSHYKRNVAFTSKFYKSFSKLLFGFESLSKYLFWIVFILLLSLTPFNSINLIICGVIILLKLILQYVFWFSANKKLGYGGFVWLQPFYELIMPITDSYMKITSFFNKKKNYTWHI